MSLLDTLKSLLGLGSSRERRSRPRDVGVTVEHEPGDTEPDAGAEGAAPGVDVTDEATPPESTPPESTTGPAAESGTSEAEPTDDAAEPDEAAAESGEGSVEIPDAEEVQSDEAAEPGTVEIPDAEELHADEAAEPEEPVDDAEVIGDETDSEAEPGDADEPTESIKGIGNAYAERLADAGVETVGDLAAADPDDLAEATDISGSRLERWVERARDR